MSSIRLLVVDDHTVVREGIRALLATKPDIEVVGEARDGGEAVTEAARL
ncbi:MAG: DNA-binding response regulator, partial [Chloroflexota bacterium]|nr:DNA-binding response regulator [Chloroflexota bacterium]